MGYKLIALDIDGTIRSEDYPLSERTRRAMNMVREAGAHVTVATGRVFRSAIRATGELDIRTPIASFQGAHVANPVTSEVLWHRPLTAEMTTAAFNALDSWGLEVIGYLGDEIYVREATDWSTAYGKRNSVKINVVEDIEELAANELTRLVVVGDNDRIKSLEASMKSQFGSDDLYITRSLAHFCEILHPLSGKDKALEWLCGHLGISQDETIAFGNGYNDVQMIAWANLGVAIGGAVHEVLEVADRVAPPIEQDGAAQVLEELLENGMIG
jgi:hypothetical protein